jgi:hypothetical protein
MTDPQTVAKVRDFFKNAWFLRKAIIGLTSD